MTRWSYGRISLPDDAAHAMFPFLAQGGTQAIEEADAFAQCLVEEPEEPVRALRTHEQVHIWRSTKIQQLSRVRKYINHLPDGLEQRERDDALAPGDPLVGNAWPYGQDPEPAATKAWV
jgi:2-polyprenyl-6-methoxyphenol hydroxylase-like FAD-dependent oxidoreductase